MKKDIEIPIAKDVYVAAILEWDAEFLSKNWNVYVLNDQTAPIEMVFAVSKGFLDDQKTSTMRHSIGTISGKAFKKIEPLLEDILSFTNEFFLTYYLDNILYEKRFVFAKNTIKESAATQILLIEKEGVMAE